MGGVVDPRAVGSVILARSGLPGFALPRGELVAGLGTFDHTADEPAAADRERREHELAGLALHGGRWRVPVVGLLLRQPPDRRPGDPSRASLPRPGGPRQVRVSTNRQTNGAETALIC